VKRLGQASFGGCEFDEPLHPKCQRLEGRMICAKRIRRIGARFDLLVEYSGDQIRALRKVTIDRPNPHARTNCDVANRGIYARFGKDRFGCLKQDEQIALRVCANAARGFGAGSRPRLIDGFSAHNYSS
jgi:hypothetical protein